MNTLMISEKSGRTLQITVDDIVAQAGGWSQAIAYKIVKLLEYAINHGIPMGVAMREAYNKSLEAAEKLTTFAKDHPFLCTLIALGVLVSLTPAVISALGFTAEGVLEGSVAASWQSSYGGYIEAGSLFSYLQKLGTMVGTANL